MSKKNHLTVGISAALKVDLTNNEIQLTPDGEFSARDGRPHSCKSWKMNTANAQQVIAKLSKRKSKIVIDYEHQTLNTEKNGQEAKASGWFYGKNVVYRPGQGLFATQVEWTANAAELINNKEYLYISPVVIYNARTGDILDIYNAALTNDPAIDGMLEVAAASNLLIQQLTNNGDETMSEELLALLRKILGLGEDATEADILAALQQIDKQVAEDAASNLINLMDKKSQNITALTAQVNSQKTAIDALKVKQGAEVDPTKYVPIEAVQALTAQVNSLKKEVTGDKVTALVEAALTAGKLLPAMKDWATNLGNKDFDALKSYVDTAPAIDALNGNQTGGKPPADNKLGLTPDELAVAKCCGLTPEEFAEAKKLGA